MLTQIYEIQTPGEADRLVEIGVDHIGSVILSEKDWKLPLVKETVDSLSSTRSRSSLIPLYSDPESIFRTLDYYRPDIVHFCEALHSGPDAEQGCARLVSMQEKLKERFPEIDIMRSIPIAEAGRSDGVPTLEFARLFEPVSDFFLTDTFLFGEPGSAGSEQPVKGFVGITGRTCDWQMASRLVKSSRIPVILAGGITPANVFDGIIQTRPAGVDSCTGTNSVDRSGRSIRFRKDMEKVAHLVKEARRAERYLMES